MTIPIEVSARHIHADAATWKKLFGTDGPTVDRPISQKPQYAAMERVQLIGPKGTIENVGVVGPLRSANQVELSQTDARRLGIAAPVRESGQLTDAAEITIVGPLGQVTASAAIIPQRHIHATAQDVAQLGVADKTEVSIEILGPRGGRLDRVIVRVDPSFTLRVHLDTDEANALGVVHDTHATLVQ